MALGYDGSINIDTHINSSGFNSGISTMTNSIKGLGAALGVALSITAIVAFGKTAVSAANQASSAWKGLEFVINANNRSFQDAKDFINEFISDGLVPASNAVEAYKNMVSRGYDTSQIEAMLNVMKDSAVYNRQASFTIGQAIQQATLGLRMENSLLTDSVGIQKNVAKMWDEYAKSIGTTANRLDDAQKRQAEFNGFMKEGGVFAGAAAGYTNSYAGQVSSLSASFYNLKVAIGNSIIPIISRVLPYIQSAINSLVIFFNKVATIMSLLFGVDISASATKTSSALDSVTSSTNSAAEAQDNLAESTAAAGKAAKGALASFDQLDVLQQETGAVGGTETPVESILPVEITTPELNTKPTEDSLDALKAKIEAFKQSVSEFFEPMREPLSNLREAFSNLGTEIGKALAITDDDKEILSSFLGILRDGFIVVIKGITIAVQWLADLIARYPVQFKIIIALLGAVLACIIILNSPILTVIAIITIVIAVLGILAQNWDLIKLKAGEAWQGIKDFFGGAAEWIRTTVTDPIREAFGTALDWIKTKWETVFTGVKDFVKGSINSIIDFINGMIRAIATGINTVISGLNSIKITIPAWVPMFGGNSWGMNIPNIQAPQIPRLANGAVIPPNAQFAAILGDQRSGNNIEAPEELIRKIVREETVSNAQNVTIKFEGTMGELIRVLRPNIQKEEKRIGKSLISGVTP